MKQFTLCSVFLFFISTCFGQSETENLQSPYRQQVVFLEAGGPAVIASVNYDVRFAKSGKGLGGRIGIGGFGGFILGLNHLIGNKGKYFEVGANVNFGPIPLPIPDGAYYDSADYDTKNGSLTLGYRYQSPGGGINLQAAVSPLFGKSYIWPYFGSLSVGYTFKNRKMKKNYIKKLNYDSKQLHPVQATN